LFLFSIIYLMRKKNKYLVFTFLYVLTMTGITFIVLQTQWDQYRFILVFVPLILIIVFSAFYYLLQAKGNFLQFLLMAVMSVFILTSLAPSVKKAGKNYPTLKRNLAGDKYYGFTEDWANYLKMSEWCGDSLPSSAYVACRKAPMSFIYAKGKPFYGVYTVFSSDPDTVMATLKSNNVTHILMASLRRNPKRVDGYTINTVQRLMYPVIQKYPNKLSLVKQIGEAEPAYLYKINY
jgi:hypothetical protein